MIIRSCPLCESNGYDKLNGRDLYVREFKNHGPKVVICNVCGLIFLNPIMIPSEYKSFYDNDEQKKFADKFIVDYNAKLLEQSYRKDLLKKYLTKDKSVIDVGCGYSYFLDTIKDDVGSVCGIEPSIIRAKAKRDKKIRIFNGEINDWKDDHSADIITVFQVLEHIVDLNAFMYHIRRILKDEGKFVIEVPNHDDFLVGIKKYNWFYYQNAHCSYFDTNTINFLLKKYGFVIEKNIKLQRYSLSNHLHWMIFGKPGRIMSISFMDRLWTEIIKKTNRHDTIFIIARKI